MWPKTTSKFNYTDSSRFILQRSRGASRKEKEFPHIACLCFYSNISVFILKLMLYSRAVFSCLQAIFPAVNTGQRWRSLLCWHSVYMVVCGLRAHNSSSWCVCVCWLYSSWAQELPAVPDRESRLMAAPARSDHVALLLGNVLHVWGGLQVSRITPDAFILYPSAIKDREGCKTKVVSRIRYDKTYILVISFPLLWKPSRNFPLICCLQYANGEEVVLPSDQIWLYDLESGLWWAE